jgi:hypothetical protein
MVHQLHGGVHQVLSYSLQGCESPLCRQQHAKRSTGFQSFTQKLNKYPEGCPNKLPQSHEGRRQATTMRRQRRTVSIAHGSGQQVFEKRAKHELYHNKSLLHPKLAVLWRKAVR